MKSRYGWIPLLTLNLILVSCSHDQSRDVSAPRGGGVDVVRAEDFATTQDLAKASTAVIESSVRPGSVRFEAIVDPQLDAMPVESRPGYYVAEFDVTKVLAGSLPASTITVRILAGTSTFSSPDESLRYVLFLYPFEWEPGKPTGEYVPVGVFAGIFQLTDDDRVIKLDDPGLGTGIPAEQSLESLVAALGAPPGP